MSDEPHAAGRLESARTRAARAQEDAARRLATVRAEHDLVDAALEAGDLDRRRAGSLLAGGIGFRIFLWMLPAGLLTAGGVGLVHPTGAAEPDRVARTLGLGASVGSIVRQATRQADQGTAILLLTGVVLTLYASMSLVRALRIAHVLAWEEPFGRRPYVLRDGAILSAALLAFIFLETGISYLRHRSGVAPSLGLSIVPVAASLGGGVALSSMLPHADANRRALLPGALLFTAGMALLHFASLYYFAPQLAKAPVLYGSLGTAATLLLWLFLIARLIVASAFLNATLWRRAQSAEPLV
jgi:uncharacterized BrkB/YihY/UPF0761 family membrane protein